MERAARLLAGRGDAQDSLVKRGEAVAEIVDQLTADQAIVLDFARHNSRVAVTGGPGSGKTWLAMEQARRWTQAGLQVGFVCYTRGLAMWVDRSTAHWPDKQRRRLWVGTFHSLGREWGVQVPDDLSPDDSHFWETTFVQDMQRLAPNAQPRFAAVVVDEAQDFADSWWPALLAGLTDPDLSPMMVFSDDQQQIFDRESAPLAGVVPLQADRNMRNSRQIARVFRSLTEQRQEIAGLDGPPVKFIECSSDEAVRAADAAAVELLDQGWRQQDVALLTTWHRHPMQIELSQDNKDDYWSLLWDDDEIFYCTVAGFKGLERPAVVLAVDGFRTAEIARKTLLVGLSRARDLLVVCGDPDLLTEVGGKELVKRLRQG